MLCTPSSTEPPMSHFQAGTGTWLSGAEKRNTSPKLSSALIQKMHGSSRPAPHAGPHFCTKTSKIAKAPAPMPPATNVIMRFRGRLPSSLRFRHVMPKTLSKAAIQSFTPTGSPTR